MNSSKHDLLAILDEATALISLPDNDFIYSSWVDAREAEEEIGAYRAQIAQDDFTNLPRLHVIFAPTGPLQEVSLSSGWGSTFLALAERFDQAAAGIQ